MAVLGMKICLNGYWNIKSKNWNIRMITVEKNSVAFPSLLRRLGRVEKVVGVVLPDYENLYK